MAQNVYSLNVVGYYNVTVPAGGGLKMVVNQLDTTNNTLKALIKNVPDGTQFFKWTGATYAGSLYEDPGGGGEWSADFDLTPGEGGFIKNNSASALTITFVGEVKQGNLTNAVPAGYNIEGSIVPQAGTLGTVLGMPAADGDQVFKWTGATYTGYLYEDPGGGGAWSPSEPSVDVGEGFFSRKNAAVNWVRNFTVPQ
jgi:hypothetical protein